MKYTNADITESKRINPKPNVMQMENMTLFPYAAQIAEATGAPAEVLPILERIMREEVFHSTLDWQTPRQFRAGAKKAYQIYAGDAEFFQIEARLRRASFHLLGAENALQEARSSADAAKVVAAEVAHEKARFEEAAARAEFERFTTC